MFTPEERKAFLQEALADVPNVRVEIFTNLVVDFAREQQATAIVKGLRAISDFEYEFEMNQLNRKLAPEIESVYIIASPDYSFLSSTGVKEMATSAATSPTWCRRPSPTRFPSVPGAEAGQDVAGGRRNSALRS